ncbi:MAG: O-antigen ligase family protein [Bacteroidales bacterium]|nr:O-antigen ligase family protein [Bacteroidales bacterium]
MLSEKTHRTIYLFSLCLLSASIPVSVFMMSVSQFIMVINYILEGNFKKKYTLLRENKHGVLFSFIFIVHVIWLLIIYPQDYNYAFNDLRIKLPILILPIVIGTSSKLSMKELKYILLSLLATFLISSLVIVFRFIFKDYFNIIDYRQYSPYISHIRCSLIAVFCFYITLYFFKNNTYNIKYFWLTLSVYIVIFIFIIKVYTGIIVLFITLFLYLLFYERNYAIKGSLISILALIVLFIAYKTYNIISEFIRGYNAKVPDKVIFTKNGNPYYFIKENYDVENGNRVWFWLCESELREEWNKRSKYKYDSLGKNGYIVKLTLLRYLTSKGLPKDAQACMSLTEEEIGAIENGISNVRYLKGDFLTNMIYNIVWQYYHYKTMNYSAGMSFVQRLIYLKTAWYIIKKDYVCGVGTGNVKSAFNKAYIETSSNLPEKYRLRAHNQYLTFFISFGIIGFIVIWFIYFYVFFKNIKLKDEFLFVIFFTITLLSFLNEDTLETQAGVTFVVFYYVIFYIGLLHKDFIHNKAT